MGFHPTWVQIMMECISTVSYSILVNGEPHGYIKPSRGLRQGDPLSPYLFLLCAEGLHSLIQRAKNEGALKGISISRGGPKLTHLFFADDSLLFCKASTTEVSCVQDLLTEYELASGQQINRQKTTLFFSRSTPRHIQNNIQGMLGVHVIRQYEKYLGLPSFVGRAKYSNFAQIKERVWSKLKGWKEKLISQAGREILIKSVAQALPTYAMNCFRLPNRLITEIEVLIRRFWWGQAGERNKMHWIPWKSLCKSKKGGGLGFRELGFFNEALLAKQVWRLMHNTTSLFYKVFKAKYFPRCSILEAKHHTRGSFAWKSIMGARSLIQKGSIWRVGDGSQIQIWEDRWLPTPYHHSIISPCPPNAPIARVSQLIDHQTRVWKQDVVRSTFFPFEAENILGIPLSHTQQADKLIWGATKTGEYAVRSGYHLLLEESHSSEPGSSTAVSQAPVWTSIWSLSIPHKARHFLWRACHDSLPTRKNLHHRHIIDDPHCPNCTASVEDTVHALWTCKHLQEVWQATEWGRKLRGSNYVDFMELYCAVTQTCRTEELQIFAMVTWSIWYRRNRQRLDHPIEELHRLLPRSIELLMEFHHAQDDVPPQPASTRPTCQPKWKPPADGSYKANFDGAIFAETSEAGIGVIIRNDQGAVMASLSQRIPYPHSVEAVEAYAARSATQFAIDLGFRDMIFEGDSFKIITALQHHSPCNTQYGHLITDTKTIAQAFISCHYVHVKRDGNRAAHSLAKRARHCEPFQVWMESVPPDLQHVILSDFLLN